MGRVSDDSADPSGAPSRGRLEGIRRRITSKEILQLQARLYLSGSSRQSRRYDSRMCSADFLAVARRRVFRGGGHRHPPAHEGASGRAESSDTRVMTDGVRRRGG